MKKKILGVLLVAVMFMGVMNVHAMTEDELKAKVSSPFNINGVSLQVPSSYIKQMNDYFDEFEVSGDDCQYVSDQIDILVNCAKTNGVKTIEDFKNKCQSEIKNACANVSSNTKTKATILSDGSVSISRYGSNEEFTRIKDVIKNTGAAKVLYIAGIISALGACILVYKLRKA